MKNLFTLAFLLMFFHGFCKDRGEHSNLRICGKWAINDTKVYSIKESCKKYSGHKQLCEETSEYDAIISIDSVTSDGFIFKWKCCHLKVNSPHVFFQKIGKLCDGVEILYKTDPNGTFMEFVNFEEVHDCLTKSLTNLQNNMPIFQILMLF